MLGIEPKALHMVGHLKAMFPASLPSLVLYCSLCPWLSAQLLAPSIALPVPAGSFLPFCRCVDEPEFIYVLRCGFGSAPLFGVMTEAAVCGEAFV